MDIEEGKVIELENGQAYLVGNNFLHDGQEYAALVSVNEPVHVRFAEINDVDGEYFITLVEDDELINLFKQYVINDFFSAVEDDENED